MQQLVNKTGIILHSQKIIEDTLSTKKLTKRTMVFIVLSSGQFGVHSSTNAVIPGETATALQPYSGFTVLTLACLTKTLACKNNIKTF